jgi:hypothetical protein
MVDEAPPSEGGGVVGCGRYGPIGALTPLLAVVAVVAVRAFCLLPAKRSPFAERFEGLIAALCEHPERLTVASVLRWGAYISLVYVAAGFALYLAASVVRGANLDRPPSLSTPRRRLVVMAVVGVLGFGLVYVITLGNPMRDGIRQFLDGMQAGLVSLSHITILTLALAWFVSWSVTFSISMLLTRLGGCDRSDVSERLRTLDRLARANALLFIIGALVTAKTYQLMLDVGGGEYRDLVAAMALASAVFYSLELVAKYVPARILLARRLRELGEAPAPVEPEDGEKTRTPPAVPGVSWRKGFQDLATLVSPVLVHLIVTMLEGFG